MKSKNAARTIINSITWFLILIVLVLAILLAGVRLLGYGVYTVLSGSMEPDIHVGALVYVKEVPISQMHTLKVGDDITFMAGEDTVVTHRIVDIDFDDGVYRFFTKGTNNVTPDTTPVHQNNVIGKVNFTVPYLGYIANFIQNPPGMYIAIAFGCVLLLLVFLPDILFPKTKDEEVKAATAPAAPAPQPAADDAGADDAAAE